MGLEQLPSGWGARIVAVLFVAAPAGCATWDGEVDPYPVPTPVASRPH
jgi:hypothetical protein